MSILAVEQPTQPITPEIPGNFDPRFACEYEVPAYHYLGFRGNIAEVLEAIKGIDDRTITLFGVELLALNVQLDDIAGGYPIYLELPGEHYHYDISMWNDRIMLQVCRQDDGYSTLSIMWPETTQQALMALKTILEDCRFPDMQPKPEEALSVLRELANR
ncbi:MAG: hypothetical protein PVI21_00275 [Candidatus Woesebacteria bacterium]|jgi:hypothetical protein